MPTEPKHREPDALQIQRIRCSFPSDICLLRAVLHLSRPAYITGDSVVHYGLTVAAIKVFAAHAEHPRQDVVKCFKPAPSLP